MAALVIFTILFLLFVASFIAAKKQRLAEDRQMAGATAAVLLVLTVAVGVGSGFTHTKSNELSINHSFGTYVSTTDPGITWVGPFTQSEKFSTRLQIQATKAEDLKLKPSDPKAVGAPAYAKYTVRWQVDGTKHAEKLWRDLRDFDAVWDKLVKPESVTSAKEVLGNYLPADATNGANVRKIGQELKVALQRVVKDKGVRIDSISVTEVRLKGAAEEQQAAVQAADAAAQKRAVEAESRQKTAAVDAETKLETAKKDRLTAAEQAAADKLRKGSVSRETLVQECLRLAEKLNQPLNCNYYMTNQYAAAPR